MKRQNNDNTIVQKHIDEETGEERMVIIQKDHFDEQSRRHFLSKGLVSAAGMIVAPSILNVLARPEFAFGADADQCAAVPLSGQPAFITVNLAGGASLAGNFLPLGEDRQPLANYNLVGAGSGQTVFTDATRGRTILNDIRASGTGDMNVPAGHFWIGLMTRAGEATLANTAVMNICVPSSDDTSSNLADASGMVLASGLVTGALLPNLGQRDGTGTGVGQMPAVVPPSVPLRVGSYADLEGALKPAGTLGTRLTESRRRKLLALVNTLSGSQARAIASPGSATGTTLAKLVECATGKNSELMSTTDPGVDPGLDAGVAGAWGINPGNKTGGTYAQAAMVYNALKGNASTCGLNLGGFDYHGAGRGNQNQQDRSAGEAVGRVLETAAAMGKAVVIHVVSDGSVSAPRDSDFGAGFTNDSGTQGMSYIFAYHPTSRPKIKNDKYKHQIGHFNAGGGASNQSLVGNTEKAAAAVFANYLAMAGQIGKFGSVAPDIFTPAQLDEIVRIA